jgi:hypothetical protein
MAFMQSAIPKDFTKLGEAVYISQVLSVFTAILLGTLIIKK